METAVVAVVVVLLVITVAIACVLCYFSCDSRAQEPHADPGHGFTVVTFQQKASLFTGPSRPAQPRTTARDFWTFM
ncbi:small regulatory polypeptide of amino acid response [Suncus etruscus]|uniref:small regulatory polypeptide of amino acid response n=1 Tax=Suncus etruscus TaxID=109475 RepID=UPI0021107D56|nr:small regulatory polypeptide of amino acid response [Suncus etruscus]